MDEDPVYVYVANHTQDGMAWGGHLVATRSRLVFTPTPKNAELGEKSWVVRLRDGLIYRAEAFTSEADARAALDAD